MSLPGLDHGFGAFLWP